MSGSPAPFCPAMHKQIPATRVVFLRQSDDTGVGATGGKPVAF
jgi:hypothetical protein